MKIVVISDTHCSRKSRKLPARLLDVLPSADLILHAGDWSDWSVYPLLSEYAPVEGVAGNTDPPEIAEKLGYSRIVEVEGLRLGLVHGHLGSKGTEQNAPYLCRPACGCCDLRTLTYPGDAYRGQHTGI